MKPWYLISLVLWGRTFVRCIFHQKHCSGYDIHDKSHPASSSHSITYPPKFKLGDCLLTHNPLCNGITSVNLIMLNVLRVECLSLFFWTLYANWDRYHYCTTARLQKILNIVMYVQAWHGSFLIVRALQLPWSVNRRGPNVLLASCEVHGSYWWVLHRLQMAERNPKEHDKYCMWEGLIVHEKWYARFFSILYLVGDKPMPTHQTHWQQISPHHSRDRPLWYGGPRRYTSSPRMSSPNARTRHHHMYIHVVCVTTQRQVVSGMWWTLRFSLKASTTQRSGPISGNSNHM